MGFSACSTSPAVTLKSHTDGRVLICIQRLPTLVADICLATNYLP